MKTRLAATCAILFFVGTSASAHRLDEYLQATTISVEKDRVQAQIRLTPGVTVFPAVLAIIDTDRDGVISEAEQRTYAGRVLGDLSLTIDGDPLQLRLISSKFASIEEMKEGRGEIQLEVESDVSSGGPNRKLVFENRHQSRIAAYLVNCLISRDPDIRITAQNRNYEQSFYQLDYVQTDVSSQSRPAPWWTSSWGPFGAAAVLVFGGFSFMRRRARASTEAHKRNTSSNDEY